jgi:nucleotide-binding universal stress UspA family protein
MKNLIVPVDFSDLSINVIDMAGKLAKAFGSKVWIIHVDSRQPYYVGLEVGPELLQDLRIEEQSRMERDLHAMEDYLKKKGVEVEAILLQGKIVTVILEQCQKLEADLVVIGSKTFGLFSRTFLGSVSEGVLRKAPCPVMVVSDQSDR